jgi:hypothetical protein
LILLTLNKNIKRERGKIYYLYLIETIL